MSKKDQAIELYNDLIKTVPNPSRATLMKLFQDKLNMTEAGSSTYASMVRASSGTPTIKAQKTTKTVQQKTFVAKGFETPEVEKSTDKRQLYSKCFVKGDEIVEISCHYDKNDALNFTPTSKVFSKKVKDLSTITIIGVPTDSDTVNDLKSKYKIIG